jgi:hypothetical protein
MIELAADLRAGTVKRFCQIGEARDEAIVEDAERGAMIARIAETTIASVMIIAAPPRARTAQ